MFDMTKIKPGFHIMLKEMLPEHVEEIVTAALGEKSAIVENNILGLTGVDTLVTYEPCQSIIYGLMKTKVRFYKHDISMERYMYLIEDAIEYITDDNGVVVYRSDQNFCVQEESIEDSSELSSFIESFTLSN